MTIDKLASNYQPFFKTDSIALYNGDCINLLKSVKQKSVDLIFADPPYFLSNNGTTCQNGKIASVNKGAWDKTLDVKSKHKFNKNWIRACRRVLKDDGTIFISGTYHNIYSVGMALEESGFQIINNITWQKLNPPPNLSCRYFTHSTETILWARKKIKNVKHTFNYKIMKDINDGKQMKDVWSGPSISKSEKKFGYHPTQKPEYLINRIILAASNDNDVILDPFLGSGTTAVVATKNHRKCIGFEKDETYNDIIVSRLKECL